MLKTALGGIDVGRIGLGCFPLTGGYGQAERAESIRTVRTALELGVNLFDTSDAYAAGENEKLLGEALGPRRQEAVIVTKFGWVLDAAGSPIALDGSPAHVRRACDASLGRLGSDHIDVYIQHRVDRATPIEDTVGELLRLKEEGKIRAIGLSEAGPATLARAYAAAPLAVLQTEYSLWSREPERELLPLCRRLEVTFMAYSPLGRGFLAGAVRSEDELAADDYRRGHPRFQLDNLRHNAALRERLAGIAERMGCTLAQLALAWLLAQPWPVLPIPATRTAPHLRENVRALDLRLTPADLDTIDTELTEVRIRGGRHPEAHLPTLDA